MELDIIRSEAGGFTLHGKINGLRVGALHVIVKDHEAEIADVYIDEFEVPAFKFFPVFKKTVSYRNKGYGSQLLKYGIGMCRELGVERLEGRMHGDLVRLRKWYGLHGFDVVDDEISLNLESKVGE